MSKYSYVKYDEEHMHMQEYIRKLHEELDQILASMKKSIAGTDRYNNYLKLAETKLEESYMYFGKANRDHQILSGGECTDIPERTNDGINAVMD